jgi:hypothetical protein
MIFKDGSGSCYEVGFSISNVELSVSANRKSGMHSSELLLF